MLQKMLWFPGTLDFFLSKSDTLDFETLYSSFGKLSSIKVYTWSKSFISIFFNIYFSPSLLKQPISFHFSIIFTNVTCSTRKTCLSRYFYSHDKHNTSIIQKRITFFKWYWDKNTKQASPVQSISQSEIVLPLRKTLLLTTCRSGSLLDWDK